MKFVNNNEDLYIYIFKIDFCEQLLTTTTTTEDEEDEEDSEDNEYVLVSEDVPTESSDALDNEYFVVITVAQWDLFGR
eukprot:Awhi_evm1s10892